MENGFRLVFRTCMMPWTQECVYFVLLTLSDAGIGVGPDQSKRGLGLEEEWFVPWRDVISLDHVRPTEPIIRIEFSTARGLTAIRDIRIPPVREEPFAGYGGADLALAIWSACQATQQAPSVDEIARILSERDAR